MILNFFLKNSSFINFNCLNFRISLNNIIIYNSILNNRYKLKNPIFLVYPMVSRYNWSTNHSLFVKFMNVNSFNFINSENFFVKKDSSSDKVNNMIWFKKKSVLFKKSDDYEFTILNRINFYRDNTYDNFLKNIRHPSTFLTDVSDSPLIKRDMSSIRKYLKKKRVINPKSIDFKRKINLVFRKNRLLLRKLLKVKLKKQNTFNKYIKNFSKLDTKNLLVNYEYNIVNLLTRSSFFFSYNDCIWFLKNGYISVDGIVTRNDKKQCKPMQVISISQSDHYYFYYRYMLDNCISNLYKFNNKIWKINCVRYHFKNKNKKEETYPTWMNKYVYYKDDVPKNLEVDYISMSMVVMNYNFDKNYIDFYSVKFLNFYLNRLYNWKYII